MVLVHAGVLEPTLSSTDPLLGIDALDAQGRSYRHGVRNYQPCKGTDHPSSTARNLAD